MCPIACRHFPDERGPGLSVRGMVAYTGSGDRLLTVQNLYVPNLYAHVFCNLTETTLEFLDLERVKISCRFALNRLFATDPDALLCKESWKSDFFPEGCAELDLMPLVGVALRGQGLPDIETLHLSPGTDYRVAGDRWIIAPPHQRPMFRFSADGKSVDTDPIRAMGIRNAMVFAPLAFGQEYALEMTVMDVTSLSSSGHLESRLGLVFPFGRVQMCPPKIVPPPGNDFAGMQLEVLTPAPSPTYPGEVFENSGPAAAAVFCRTVRDQMQGELTSRGDISKDPSLYAVLADGPCGHLLTLGLDPAEDVQACVLQHSHVVNATLLPTLRRWLGAMGCPLHIVLVNSGETAIDLVVKETNQTSSKSRIETYRLGPHELRHEPLELPGLGSDACGDLSLAIEVESAGVTVMRVVASLRLLKPDHLVLRIEDEIRDWYRDTVEAVACWVTPEAAAVDTWVSEARLFCTEGMGSGAGVPVEQQLSALWGALQQRSLTYVDRSYSIDTGSATSYQRVCTPSETLALGSGNCIDLTVLFASALEQLGFRPAILTTTGHAFLGWLDDEGAVRGCLETTMISQADCAAAMAVGHSGFGSPEEFTNHRNGRVIDVLGARQMGLLPLFD